MEKKNKIKGKYSFQKFYSNFYRGILLYKIKNLNEVLSEKNINQSV